MNADEHAIRELIAHWLAASKAGETDAVLKLMADDVVFLVAGRPPMRGKTAFAAAQASLADVAIDATSDVQEIRVAGDWAYAWTRLTVVMTPRGGMPVRRSGSTLSIFRKEHGAWRLFRDANLLSADVAAQDA